MTEKKKKTIVLIEDDSVLAEMYLQKFTHEGYAIFHALDGDEGLALVKQHSPDLIFLDIMMPKKSGIEVLEELKRDEATKAVPVVMLSNVGEEQYLTQSEELGALDHLLKSDYTPSEIVAKTEELLARQP